MGEHDPKMCRKHTEIHTVGAGCPKCRVSTSEQKDEEIATLTAYAHALKARAEALEKAARTARTVLVRLKHGAPQEPFAGQLAIDILGAALAALSAPEVKT